MRLIRFDVIDNRTGKSPDCETIALTEEWAKRLVYCDIDCFAITEDGNLILIDDCNNIAYPPSDRFTVTIDPESLRKKGEWISVEDRLPEGECLAVSMITGPAYKEMLIGWVGESSGWDTGYECESDGEILPNVTHWMPLPEPPDMRGEE